MRKKSHSRKSKALSKTKTVGHYLKVYFVSLSVGLIVFLGSSFFAKPQIPCANSGTCVSDLTENIDNESVGFFDGHKVIPPKIDLAQDMHRPSVLGANIPSGEKHIYVDLATQQLYAYQGDTQIIKTFIASGKWKPTPTGNFHIWEKLRSTRMSGGEGADAYDLPNVQYVMYFYSDFGLHGAYWHDNFGHMMSHGCVNMRDVDAQVVFDWADVGTAVSVCDTFSEPKTCVQNHPVQ
jgi:lipoprotein-anchoring transpeptidase ErfK/SrfK